MPDRVLRGSRLVVGLISGTSMDGIDAALVRISGSATQPRVRLVAFKTMPYPDWLRNRLLAVAGGDSTTAEEIDQLNTLLGAAFGEAATRACRRGGIKPGRLFVVGSHGQTIHHYGGPRLKATREFLAAARKLIAKTKASMEKTWATEPGPQTFGIDLTHFPEVLKTLKKGTPAHLELWSVGRPCTLQIAEPALIAERTGAPVVADFRTADMAVGGQGAPLVPMVDYLLLRDARKGTVALNIGGIANFTVIPAGAEPEQVFGFDTGPGNMIIDGLVRHFTKGRKSYDAGGRWAAKGRVIEPLLDRILRFPFFTQQPPKSAGREQFGQWFITHFFLSNQGDAASPLKSLLTPTSYKAGDPLPAPAGENASGGPPSPQGRGLEIKSGDRERPEDLIRTATELTACTIADALERFVLGKIAIQRLIISGGGAHNRLLVARLTELLPRLRVHRSDEFGLDVDAKEAIAFAVLADRTMHGLPGNLPTVTGARRPVVLGRISRPGSVSSIKKRAARGTKRYNKPARTSGGGTMATYERRLEDLVSIGPAMLKDFELLGIRSVAQLARQKPERLYEKLCRVTGKSQDICVLDTFCAAVAQARDPKLPAEQRQWWYWSRQRKAKE